MKKGEEYVCRIEEVKFPNIGIADIDGQKVRVKYTIKGQLVRTRINKKRRDKVEGRLLEVVEKSALETAETCSVFGVCGGCLNQSLPYDEQLKQKEEQVLAMLAGLEKPFQYDGIVGSPETHGYRNKMEFSFGDESKDGPLALGMHKRGSHHDIVNMTDCRLIHHDYNLLAMAVKDYFSERETSFYHKIRHEGFLRHLVIRHGKKQGQLMVNLVTSSQGSLDADSFISMLMGLTLENEIRTVIHTINDSLADIVQADAAHVLYGDGIIEEELLGLKFKISPFSFFQTNTYGAEKLYEVVRSYVGDTKDQVVFDLYSGTGTIAQLVAPVAKKAVGVEIVKEAVLAAGENAKHNGLDNCEFIAGDVLKVLDDLTDKPDMIILDPPRDGIHPKALPKIIDYGVDRLVYVSCKPTSLVRDLAVFIGRGYEVERVTLVDMFPHTGHVETCVSLKKIK